jgi:hypothetical protein
VGLSKGRCVPAQPVLDFETDVMVAVQDAVRRYFFGETETHTASGCQAVASRSRAFRGCQQGVVLASRSLANAWTCSERPRNANWGALRAPQFLFDMGQLTARRTPGRSRGGLLRSIGYRLGATVPDQKPSSRSGMQGKLNSLLHQQRGSTLRVTRIPDGVRFFMSWKRPFDEPIPLPRGRSSRLRTQDLRRSVWDVFRACPPIT